MVEGATQTGRQRTATPAVGPFCDAVSCKRPPAVGPLAQALMGEARTPAPSVDPGTALQNRAAIRLLGTPCRMETEGAIDLDNPAQLNQSVPLAAFDPAKPLHECVAFKLREFLANIRFDEANKRAHPAAYGVTPIYDNHDVGPDAIKQNSDLTGDQKLAMLFFQYGQGLTPDAVRTVFAGNLDLFADLQDLGIVVAEKTGAEVTYRLNGLSLESYRLPHDQTMYLFVDLPRRFRSSGMANTQDPTVQLSTTSYILLGELVSQYQAGASHSGLAADFGSGSGILAIALLKMHPRLSEVLAVEIDSRAMNLSRLNAMVNDVGNRFQVVDNAAPKNFGHALRGRKLDLAVSNPPFNAVPSRFATEFTDFGDGGPHGLDVTEIFM